jgi:hypothetical protein
MDGGYKMHWIDVGIAVTSTRFRVKKRKFDEVGMYSQIRAVGGFKVKRFFFPFHPPLPSTTTTLLYSLPLINLIQCRIQVPKVG